ncbi:MAG: CPBP family intramembrane metalloprotease [Candidatus Aureabacteria bacterium]|nr:CPBP family intramembrane metalloprotease [Candidatus Auribacterota bacterium]
MKGTVLLIFISYIVFLDAKTLQNEKKDCYDANIKRSPLAWFFLSFLFFLFVMPIYFLRRNTFFNQIKTMLPAEDIQTSRHPHFKLLSQSLGILIIWAILFNFLSLLLPLAVSPERSSLLFMTSTGLLSNIIFLIIIYKTLLKEQPPDFLTKVNWIKTDNFIVKSLLLPFCAGFLLAFGYFQILSGRNVIPQSPISQAISGSSLFPLLIFIIFALIMPVFEEIIFRGYFYSILEKIKGSLFAFGVITIVFALWHVEQLWQDWLGMVLIFGVGLLLTGLRFWTHSIVPSVIAHFTYNFSLLIAVPLLSLYLSSPPYFKITLTKHLCSEAEKESLLKESIEKYPRCIPAYNELAWYYAKKNKNLKEGLTYINQALLIKPENAAFLDTKAELLYQLKQFEAALLIEESLIKQYPDNHYFQKQADKFKKALKNNKDSILRLS